MRCPVFACLLCLSACASPAPPEFGCTAKTQVDDSYSDISCHTDLVDSSRLKALLVALDQGAERNGQRRQFVAILARQATCGACTEYLASALYDADPESFVVYVDSARFARHYSRMFSARVEVRYPSATMDDLATDLFAPILISYSASAARIIMNTDPNRFKDAVEIELLHESQ